MCKKIALLFSLVIMGFTLTAQNTVSGKIVTSDGQPAALVNIELKGYNKNCVSNKEGRFAISDVADGSYELIASFVGLQTQQKSVIVAANKSTMLDFVITENAQQLKDVTILSRKGLNAQVVSIGKIAIDPHGSSAEQ
jgi:iron complex outermembrane receptor protein